MYLRAIYKIINFSKITNACNFSFIYLSTSLIEKLYNFRKSCVLNKLLYNLKLLYKAFI